MSGALSVFSLAGGRATFDSLMIPKIANQKVKISIVRETVDMSDLFFKNSYYYHFISYRLEKSALFTKILYSKPARNYIQ
jgi:hypothetical protein